MADIEFNGSSSSRLNFNGVAMNTLIFNGTAVWNAFTPADAVNDVNTIGSGLVTATQEFLSDGSCASGTWGTPALTGVGSEYELLYTVSSGGDNGAGVGVWRSLASTQTFENTALYFNGNPQTSSTTVIYRIRPSGGGFDVSSGTFIVQADSTAP